MSPWPLAGITTEFLIHTVSHEKDLFINLRCSNLTAYIKEKKYSEKSNVINYVVFFSIVSHATELFNSDK